MNNSNEQQFQTDPAQLHQGVARIERAFGDLAARFVASNERVERALQKQQEQQEHQQQQQAIQGFELGETASLAQQAAWERGRAAEAPELSEQAQREEEAQMAEIQAWAEAHRDVPVEEESDPLEAHKKIWLDVVDPEPVK